jgi:chitinase
MRDGKDNEDNLPSHFDTLASTLRQHYTTASKPYYLSSAPQCPFPDASNPLPLLLLCDFVWVQFYNNAPCEIGSSGFAASIQQWSTALENSTLASPPRLYLGAPAFSEAGASAYAHIGDAEGMKGIASSVEKMGLANFGGVMFWDGPEGMLNLAGGKDIISWAKEGLDS